MKILAIFRVKAGVSMSQVLPLIAEEERMAWAKYLAGELRETYLTSQPGVVLDIFEAPSVTELQQEMLALPLMRAGLLEATYYDLLPFKNWEALFADGNKTPVSSAQGSTV